MKKAYGSYLTEAEAREAMGHLYELGYMREEIKIVSINNSDENEDDNNDNESMWDKIKETFTPEDNYEKNYEKNLNHNERKEIEEYESNLQAGEVVLLVEEKAGHHHKEGINQDFTHDEKVETSEVDVKKVTKHETETVEVPIEKEEVVIERKSASGRKVEDGEFIEPDPYKDEEEIHIPIKEERINVSKDTVVNNEVVISKDKHKENKIVTKDVKYEDIEVDGNSELNEGLKDKKRRSEDR